MNAEYYIIIFFPMRFKKQWNNGNAQGGGIRLPVCRRTDGGRSGRRVEEVQQPRADKRVENRLQVPPRRIGRETRRGRGRRIGDARRCGRPRRGEDCLRKAAAVYSAVRRTDAFAEAGGDRLHRRPAGGLKFVDDVVRVNKPNAKFPKELGKQALAAGDSACQDNAHGVSWRRERA